MTFYMLDTNVLTAMALDPDGSVASRFQQLGPEDVAISIIVASEVRFGVAKNEKARSVPAMLAFVDAIRILPFEVAAETLYGQIRADLERRGYGLTPNDYFIAAHAMEMDAVLVTGDQAILNAPLEKLKVENWLRV